MALTSWHQSNPGCEVLAVTHKDARLPGPATTKFLWRQKLCVSDSIVDNRDHPMYVLPSLIISFAARTNQNTDQILRRYQQSPAYLTYLDSFINWLLFLALSQLVANNNCNNIFIFIGVCSNAARPAVSLQLTMVFRLGPVLKHPDSCIAPGPHKASPLMGLWCHSLRIILRCLHHVYLQPFAPYPETQISRFVCKTGNLLIASHAKNSFEELHVPKTFLWNVERILFSKTWFIFFQYADCTIWT